MANQASELSNKAYDIIYGNENPDNPVVAQGKEYLFSKYPEEFEYYALAFELVDATGGTVMFFSFPVLPDNIHITTHPLTSIKRTMTGIVVNNNPVFPDSEIKISGNFGRKFKRIQTEVNIEDPAGSYGKNNFNTQVIKKVEFDTDWKTGYGCTKILETIFKMSKQADPSNNPYRLFFYNLAFNQALFVEITDFSFTMSRELNCIWQYDVTMKVLGNASNFNKHNSYNRKKLLQMTKLLQSGNDNAKQVVDVLASEKGKKGYQSKLQKFTQTEIGKRVYQVATAYTPNVLRTSLQLAEDPSTIKNFVANEGSNTFETISW